MHDPVIVEKLAKAENSFKLMYKGRVVLGVVSCPAPHTHMRGGCGIGGCDEDRRDGGGATADSARWRVQLLAVGWLPSVGEI
jgi:hypothetical protein